LDELWRIVGAYRPQKELADALKKSKSSRVDAVNRLKAEHTQRITMQHHAADQAQCIADLRRDRDELRAANATLHDQVNDWHRKAVETRAERDALAVRLDLQAKALSSELAKAREVLARTEWKPLTDERVIEIRKETKALDRQWGDTIAFARAIEAAVLAADRDAARAEAADMRRDRDAQAARLAKTKGVTLNAAQLRHALEFVAPDFDADPDQRESEVTIAWRDAGVVADDDGNPEPAGYVAWITDYPEEGALPLQESWDVMPADAPAQASGRRVAVDAGALQMVINALRRDAEDGRPVRGEMADALLAAAPELADHCEEGRRMVPERAEPEDMLRAVLGTDVARQTRIKLGDGQGTNTADCQALLSAGQAWLSAFALAGAAPAQAAPTAGCGACGDACRSRASCRLADESPEAEPTRCQADRDGDCSHPDCPQLRDSEPHATGRWCPLGAEGGAA
ncbi:MAG: hypothetical protein ACKOXG_00340, partial [Arenimonas sp.]